MVASGRALTVALLVSACACSNRSEPTESSPTRVVADAAVVVVPACARDPKPDGFMCAASTLCGQPRSAIDVFGFLCAARSAKAAGESLRVSEVLSGLPGRFRRSFTLKHGIAQSRLRGHAKEFARLSTSADLDFPRVIMWDEVTGFTISFNGGLEATDGTGREQSAARRLGMLTHDAKTRQFQLWALDIPARKKEGAWSLVPYQPTNPKDDCKRCHGPRSRPIWPMYPDWPGFYGSDNDELTKPTKHQTLERDFHGYVRGCIASADAAAKPACVAMRKRARSLATVKGKRKPSAVADTRDTRRRYATLFDEGMRSYLNEIYQGLDKKAIQAFLTARAAGDVKRHPTARLGASALAAASGDDAALARWLGLTIHPSFPYRPNHALQLAEASRAFFHRPNSRLGILYNRLNARNLMEVVRAHPTYASFKKLIAFGLMDCSWRDQRAARVATYAAFEKAAARHLAAVDMVLPGPDASDDRILYPALLASIGLTVRDTDIRFSYPNRRFKRFDRGYKKPSLAATAMGLGYIAYRAKDHNKRVNGAVRYFNSYFDGSASFDELLVGLILQDIGRQDPALSKLYQLNSLKEKYAAVGSRWPLDAPFLSHADTIATWFPLPYPNHLFHIHHRQSFKELRERPVQFAEQHRAVCGYLRGSLGKQHGVGR